MTTDVRPRITDCMDGPPIQNPLTERQKQVLCVMVTFRFLNGFWPKIRDIGASLEPPLRNPHGIMSHLNFLEKKGWIRRHCVNGRVAVFEVIKPCGS